LTFALACFADETAPAGRLAEALGAPLQSVHVHRFPDGETMPRVEAPAAETTIVYRALDRPNAKLVDLILAADAWRRAGARRLILVAPYFCYLRQDAVFAPGEPLSRDVIAPLIGARFDGVVTVQAHLHRTADLGAALGTAAENLWSVEPLAEALPAYAPSPLVIGPDAESGPWAEALAARLHGEAICLRKTRRGDRSVAIEAPEPPPAAGRPVVIIDDVAASGETLVQAVSLAKAAGAVTIDVAVVHALMDEAAVERLRRSGARQVISADGVLHPTNAARLAPLLAQAVQRMTART
jgi:ribose-phosphate pyrophosphokinase